MEVSLAQIFIKNIKYTFVRTKQHSHLCSSWASGGYITYCLHYVRAEQQKVANSVSTFKKVIKRHVVRKTANNLSQTCPLH